GLPLDVASGWPWLALALLAVAVTSPVLMAVELAVNLSSQAAQVQSLRQEIHQAAAWVDSRLAVLGVTGPTYPTLPDEADAAAEALLSAGRADYHSPPSPAPLVLDLLK